MFQKIPHKERLRQARYRSEHEEKLEENRIRKYMAELEAAKCSQQPTYENEKCREEMEMLRRLGLLTHETRNEQ